MLFRALSRVNCIPKIKFPLIDFFSADQKVSQIDNVCCLVNSCVAAFAILKVKIISCSKERRNKNICNLNCKSANMSYLKIFIWKRDNRSNLAKGEKTV